MTQLIYLMIEIISKLHSKFLSLNDKFGIALSDKQLHFLVIGLFGFCLLLLIQPLFEWFSKHDGVLFVTFTYVFTVILVVTFAIEIGQGFSGTGDMDFYDIVSGIFGYLAFFILYLVIYVIYRELKKIIKKKRAI